MMGKLYIWRKYDAYALCFQCSAHIRGPVDFVHQRFMSEMAGLAGVADYWARRIFILDLLWERGLDA